MRLSSENLNGPIVLENETTPRHKDPGYLKVVAKTFRVIEALAQAEGCVQLSELARSVKQPKATVFRILYTLKELGYVQQDTDTQTYKLSNHAGWLARREVKEALKRVARPYLERLLGSFEQTVCLAMLDKDRLYYVEILEGLRSIRMSAAVNSYAPLHSTSLGKSILAFLDPSERLQILAKRPLEKLTPKTITSLSVLNRHLSMVRREGYAADNEETEKGARCVGAPVFNAQGRSFAAISISGPVSHMRIERVPEIAQAIQIACKNVSERLGFSGVYPSAENQKS